MTSWYVKLCRHLIKLLISVWELKNILEPVDFFQLSNSLALEKLGSPRQWASAS